MGITTPVTDEVDSIALLTQCEGQPIWNAGLRVDTEVAELGVACGACHGPAAEHAEAAGSPLTRSLWRLSSSSETHIVNPSKLTPERSMMVCGHCHGQRIPAEMELIQEIFRSGDPYNAGEDLSKYYNVVTRKREWRHSSQPLLGEGYARPDSV